MLASESTCAVHIWVIPRAAATSMAVMRLRPVPAPVDLYPRHKPEVIRATVLEGSPYIGCIWTVDFNSAQGD